MIDRIAKGIGNPPLARRNDANGIDLATAQKAAFGIGSQVTQFHCSTFHGFPHLRFHPLGMGKNIGDSAARYTGGACDIEERGFGEEGHVTSIKHFLDRSNFFVDSLR